MTEKKSNLGYKITIILLSAVIVWLVYDKITTKTETVEMITIIEQTTHDKDSLINELEDLYDAYGGLETNNAEINDSLAVHKAKIEELMKELENVEAADSYKIQQLKDEVATLKTIMKSFVRQIDSLYQENQILIAENQTITENYTEAVEINENLIIEKDSLQETVNIAKELAAYSISFDGLNRRKKSTTRIKKVENFYTCFTLSENKLTSTGRKTIYIRITKPTGKVLRNDNSGYFNYQGQSIAFSASKEIDYNGSSQNICLYYSIVEDNLPDGTYSIFIFADGKQIGDADLYLK